MVQRYGILVDLDKCIACYACAVACKQENDLPPHGDGVPFIEGPQWMKVHTIGPMGDYPDLTMYFIPRLCMHCAEAPCIEACPHEAIYRREDGIVLIDEDKCCGTQHCIWACPYGAIYYRADKGVAGKCTLCVHRIDKGLEPACVLACPTGALSFGDVSAIEMTKELHVIPVPDGTDPKPLVRYMKSR